MNQALPTPDVGNAGAYDYAGILSRAAADLLATVDQSLAGILSSLPGQHPLSSSLREIEAVVRAAREINERLAESVQLHALTDRHTGDAITPPHGPVLVALIVESDHDLRCLIGEVLKRLGYLVLEAASTGEAERLFQLYDGLVHLLVSEVTVTGGSGISLGTRLRSLRPSLAIVYTSSEQPEPRASLASTRRTAMIQKPFTINNLAQVVQEAVAA